MLVRDIMRSPAVVISPETTLQDAYKTMREQGIRHLPVVEGDRLVGTFLYLQSPVTIELNRQR